MFLGHYGVAFALKRVEPKVSLAVLFFAVEMVDILFGATLLLGWERAAIVPGAMAASPLVFDHYPITHSLVAGLVWGAILAALYYSWPTTDTSRHLRASLVVGIAVLSHWPLDVLVHGPDLPIAGDGSLQVGFGLWNSVPLSAALEVLVFGLGLAAYLGLPRTRRRVHRWRIAVLSAVLVAIYVAALVGPPPPDVEALAYSLLLLTLPALLAIWAARRTA